MKSAEALLIKGIPTLLGFGLAWLGITLIKNEKRLLIRQIELKSALTEKSKRERRIKIVGKRNSY